MKCVKERVGNRTFLFMAHQDFGEICLLRFQVSSFRPQLQGSASILAEPVSDRR